MPPSRENVRSVQSCLSVITERVDSLIKGFEQHRKDTKDQTDALHTRIGEKFTTLTKTIQSNEDKREREMGKIQDRLDLIDQRHDRVDGARTVKAGIGAAAVLLLASIGGAITTFVINAWQGIK